MELLYKKEEFSSMRGRKVYNAMQMGFHKNPAWITKMIRGGFITPRTGDLSTSQKKLSFINRVCSMIEVFNSKYDNDWDIVLKPIGFDIFRLSFIHLHKDFDITNSRGGSHHIKGLVTVYDLFYNSNGLHIEEIKGTRLSIHPKEVDAGYRHSHLNTMNTDSSRNVYSGYAEPSYFCVGNSTPVEILTTDLRESFEKDRFELYLYSVEDMVHWESIEGGPYNNMSNITYRRKHPYNMSIDDAMYYFHYAFEVSDKILPLDFYFENDRIKIKNNEALVTYLKNIFPTDIRDILLIKYNIAEQKYYSYSEELAFTGDYTLDRELTQHYLYYQGQKKQFKIQTSRVSETEQVSNIDDYTFHPKFLENVITKLHSELYLQSLRLCRINLENSSNNISRSTSENQVFV